MNNTGAAILAGGKSSRFPGNKALATWYHYSIIETIVKILEPSFRELFIISNSAQDYSHIKLDIYPDIIPGYGPISGIHSALKHSRAQRIFIVACDMPALNINLINWMCSIDTWAPIVIPELNEGMEPLHAIYHKSLTPLLETIISTGKTGMQRIIKQLPYRSVSYTEIKRFCPDLLCLKNTNTLEELKRLKEVFQYQNPT